MTIVVLFLLVSVFRRTGVVAPKTIDLRRSPKDASTLKRRLLLAVVEAIVVLLSLLLARCCSAVGVQDVSSGAPHHF